MSNQIVKATSEDDPERCQAVNSQGQCRNKGVALADESIGTYCIAHGGNGQQASVLKAAVSNYRLERWQSRLAEKAEAEGLKSLRDEIGILRIVLEERLAKCDDAHDLILQSGPISDMVMKIERVVTSCHKLEGSMGQLLDKQAILQFAQMVIGILGVHITDESLLNTIADEIVGKINDIG